MTKPSVLLWLLIAAADLALLLAGVGLAGTLVLLGAVATAAAVVAVGVRLLLVRRTAGRSLAAPMPIPVPARGARRGIARTR
jgi:hypothetical protein